jgi:hypothetical protein
LKALAGFLFAAAQADHLIESPVQINNVLRSRLLMQSVYILCDQQIDFAGAL